ncbi:MAG: hypothetical protein AAFP02_18500, partial [Bacteroidota bacterium]
KAALNITGNLTFDYLDADASEGHTEISLSNESVLDVTGKTYINHTGGGAFNWTLTNTSQVVLRDSLFWYKSGGRQSFLGLTGTATFESSKYAEFRNSNGAEDLMVDIAGGKLTVSGDLMLNSTNINEDVLIAVNGSGNELEVTNDIYFKAVDDADVSINLTTSAKLLIGGDFKRPTNYGVITMDATSSLEYNSNTNQQSIACNRMSLAVLDSFDLKNVSFNNTSGLPMKLEGTLRVYDELVLGTGIIQTNEDTLIILEDQASISGGSTTSFIDGPIRKIGRTTGSAVTLPLGENGVYAPMTHSKVENVKPASTYTARFRSCPPPFGNTNLASGLEGITENQYWELETGLGSDSVNVGLHWSDGASLGITSTAPLVVAMGDETNPTAPEWVSIGQGSLTGDVTAGSVFNLTSCPPPFGNTKFT